MARKKTTSEETTVKVNLRKNVKTNRSYISAVETAAGKQTPNTILVASELDMLYLDDEIPIELMKAAKLSKEFKNEISTMSQISKEEIRDVVNVFYQLQDMRKGLANMMRAIDQGNTGQTVSSNSLILKWLLMNVSVLEKETEKALDAVTDANPVGRWLKQINGIGPILAAGMLGNFEIGDRKYATSFISYAGLNDNNRPWLGSAKAKTIVDECIGGSKTITDDMVHMMAVKSQWSYNYLLENAYNQDKGKWDKTKLQNSIAKIPYNKKLKTLMWKVGDCFIKVSNKPESLYGRLYRERKTREMERNEMGMFKDQAAHILATKNIGKATEAYKWYSQGKLPPAHIVARAQRYAEQVLLVHLFEEMYRVEKGTEPPRYYPLEHCEGHHDYIGPEVPYTEI